MQLEFVQAGGYSTRNCNHEPGIALARHIVCNIPVVLRIAGARDRALALRNATRPMRTGGMTVEKLNRQRVLHLLDTFARSDLEAALACCTDDVDFLTHAPIDVLPHMGPRHGKQELREFWRTVQTRYAETRYEVPQIVAEDDTVAANLRVFFKKRSNDRIVQVDMAVFYTFRDGLIAQIREIIDSYDLVQQVLEREIGPLIVGAAPVDGV
jgi:ketosteroid isomerase-like protein